MAGERVELHSAKAKGAVANDQHYLTVREGELRGQRVAGPRAEAAKRARVEPAARLIGVDHLSGEGDEVAAVADHDRVTVKELV